MHPVWMKLLKNLATTRRAPVSGQVGTICLGLSRILQLLLSMLSAATTPAWEDQKVDNHPNETRGTTKAGNLLSVSDTPNYSQCKVIIQVKFVDILLAEVVLPLVHWHGSHSLKVLKQKYINKQWNTRQKMKFVH